MVYAQITGDIILNTIVLNDASLLPLFQNDPNGNPYDLLLQIDTIYPRPGVGWTFDGILFYPPIQTNSDLNDGEDDGSDGGGLLGGLL